MINIKPQEELQIDAGTWQIHFAVKDNIGMTWITGPTKPIFGTKNIFSSDVKNILFGDWNRVIYQKMNGDTVHRSIKTVFNTIVYFPEFPT